MTCSYDDFEILVVTKLSKIFKIKSVCIHKDDTQDMLQEMYRIGMVSPRGIFGELPIGGSIELKFSRKFHVELERSMLMELYEESNDVKNAVQELSKYIEHEWSKKIREDVV